MQIEPLDQRVAVLCTAARQSSGGGAMTRVFISYSRNDRRRNRRAVTDLTRALDAAGFAVWRDSELVGGQSWWDEILSQLRSADAVVAVISPTSTESVACRSELAYANAVHRIVIPVQVDDLGPESAPGNLPSVQWIDYRKRSQDGLLSLVKAVNRANPEPLPSPLPDTPEAPPPPPTRIKWWQRPKFRLLGAGAAGVVALVAVVLVAVAIWPEGGDDTEVSVPGDRAWTDTGMEVGIGDVVTVQSSGRSRTTPLCRARSGLTVTLSPNSASSTSSSTSTTPP